jgi:hypothetical protein
MADEIHDIHSRKPLSDEQVAERAERQSRNEGRLTSESAQRSLEAREDERATRIEAAIPAKLPPKAREVFARNLDALVEEAKSKREPGYETREKISMAAASMSNKRMDAFTLSPKANVDERRRNTLAKGSANYKSIAKYAGDIVTGRKDSGYGILKLVEASEYEIGLANLADVGTRESLQIVRKIISEGVEKIARLAPEVASALDAFDAYKIVGGTGSFRFFDMEDDDEDDDEANNRLFPSVHLGTVAHDEFWGEMIGIDQKTPRIRLNLCQDVSLQLRLISGVVKPVLWEFPQFYWVDSLQDPADEEPYRFTTSSGRVLDLEWGPKDDFRNLTGTLEECGKQVVIEIDRAQIDVVLEVLSEHANADYGDLHTDAKGIEVPDLMESFVENSRGQKLSAIIQDGFLQQISPGIREEFGRIAGNETVFQLETSMIDGHLYDLKAEEVALHDAGWSINPRLLDGEGNLVRATPIEILFVEAIKWAESLNRLIHGARQIRNRQIPDHTQ